MLDPRGDDVLARVRRAKYTPLSARLFASLPPLVNTTSSCAQPSNAATWARAFSSAALGAGAAQCALDGLP